MSVLPSLLETIQHITEANIVKTLEPLKDRSFGVLNLSKNDDANKLFQLAAQKAGYDVREIQGSVLKPAKKKDDDPIEVPDAAVLVVGTEKTQSGDLRKFLFRQAERLGRASFIFKPSDNTKAFLVGVSEYKKPGRNIAVALGEYSPLRFVSLLNKFKGKNYTFERLS